MVMKDYIKEFPNHISDALSIAKSISLNEINNIQNIIILGQGGSAIGGVIVKNLLKEEIRDIPIIINQDYTLPNFVNNKTLVIASSYSGNTEETLSTLQQANNKNGKIFCIWSGGEMQNFAINNSIPYVIIPSGRAPRAMLCYSIIQILFVICKINKSILSKYFNQLENNLLETRKYLISCQESIINISYKVASDIGNNMPFIYTYSNYEGVAIRFKQQLNENAKKHACYNLIPEMNHNEIVPWIKKTSCVIPIFINPSNNQFDRNIKRMALTIKSIKKNVKSIVELKLNNSTYIQQYFYFLHLVDWISIRLAELDNVDPDNIELIDKLKKHLKKL
ncbi:MAG: bifunctional phosphoglucose/phosphomannose isomerase [Flavobacteriales bacterium]|nr:bifunctional phosphoglucose/phosphomannose isomerase [Flavobacteriales bacterium]